MRKKLSPPKALALGFLAIILAGTFLLVLPFSTRGGCSLTDALFTATSAVCVTGLIVKDTPVDFTLFGQLVIMMLIQVGGLGYMTSATIIPILAGKRIGLGERVLMKEALNVLSVEGVVRFTKTVLKVTLLFELAGAVVLSARFAADMPLPKALYFGLFHSVSAFNNAGFSLFSDNLMGYRTSISVNLAVCALIVCGGIGFVVISDIYRYRRGEVARLSQHTKIVLAATSILTAGGALFFLGFEYFNPGTLHGAGFRDKALASFFSSVTSRTAGFNTLDFSRVMPESLFLVTLLMFIGASPGSTGGGVKTTTFFICVSSIWSTVRGKTDVVAFHRRIGDSTVHRSFTLVGVALLLVASVSLVVIYVEGGAWPACVFEVVSAFGTVGLSVGDGGSRSLSALFSPVGKLIITLTMYAGRLGPLALAMAMLEGEKQRFRRPEGKVIIG